MDFLQENIDWPIALREVRIQSGASVAGRAVRDIPLRAEVGVHIMAVSRAGRAYFDPEPDFRIFPGDRLVIMGSVEGLMEAENLLRQYEDREDEIDGSVCFVLNEVKVGETSLLGGRDLSETRFRQVHGVSVVGIRREEEDIVAPAPSEKIMAGDTLIVMGNCKLVEELKRSEPL
jgi:K+/H+ antiporter YhaU regulatory subunit KhtT